MSRPKSCSFCGRMTFGAGLLIEGDANVRARICRACALKCLNLFDRRETEAHDAACLMWGGLMAAVILAVLVVMRG